MHNKTCTAAVAALIALSPVAHAIDRDARMIDTIAVESMNYDGGDSLGLSLWGETATAMKEGKWAILFGGGIGTIWPDAGDGIEYWELGLGLKYYLLQDTSLALLGTYRELNMQDRPDILTTDLTLKHRFIPATETVSPFLRAGIGVRTVEYIPEPPVDEDFKEMIISFGAGVDFMMAENFAIVFDATWYVTQKLDDDETPDFWIGRVGMQYYWH